MNPEQTRRDFCAQTCRAASLVALASGLGTMLEACGRSPTAASSFPLLPTLNATPVSGSIVLTIDSSSPLATVGGAALVQSSAGNFLVARTGQSSFSALTAVCTHQGCTITQYQSPTYMCPCHGSEYDTSGRVLQGPAPSALRQFATQFGNNVLTITR